MPVISPSAAGGLNVCAALDMIATSELLQAVLNGSDNGYNVLVGSTPNAIHSFASYADHPRIYVPACNSDAAGRYQIMSHWWPAYKAQLELPDFGPLSQDRYAIQQIKESRAYGAAQAGDIATVITNCAHIWASLPGNSYGQHTQPLDFLKAAYVLNGGTVTGAAAAW
jgi:muramidase (phage lysozyme)